MKDLSVDDTVWFVMDREEWPSPQDGKVIDITEFSDCKIYEVKWASGPQDTVKVDSDTIYMSRKEALRSAIKLRRTCIEYLMDKVLRHERWRTIYALELDNICEKESVNVVSGSGRMAGGKDE